MHLKAQRKQNTKNNMPKNTYLVFVIICISLCVKTIFTMLHMEDLGTGKSAAAIAAFITLMLVCYCAIESRYLRPVNGLTKIVIAWIVWNIITLPFHTIISSSETIIEEDFVRSLFYGLVTILLWPLLYCFYCIHTRKNQDSQFLTKIAMVVLALVNIVMFFFLRNVHLVDGSASDFLGGKASLGYVYYLLPLLPWVFIINNKYIENAGIGAIALCVLCSNKRTAIIALVIAYLLKAGGEMYVARSKRNVYGIVAVCMLLVFGCAFFYIDTINDSYYTERLLLIKTDQGSGRMGIYETTFDMIDRSSASSFLIGHGYNAVARDSHYTSAHNDWLEVFYDYGLGGVIIYLLLYLYLLKRVVALLRNRSEVAPAYLASVGLFVVISAFSHLIIYPNYFWYLTSFWGFTESIIQRRRQGGDGHDIPRHVGCR